MFERLRFIRYALRFERAFKTDEWAPVKACFHRDAVYTIDEGTPYSGEHRGPDAIVAVFQRMLNDLDRKFDRRQPKLRGWWRVKDGVLHVPWAARYTMGDQSFVLTGESTCEFEGAAIISLRDTVAPEDWERWTALAATPRAASPRQG